jgi:serine/threonine-protein kinase
MLCGRRLFDATGEVEVMLQIAEGPIPPPSSLNPRVPPALSDVVMRALERDLDKRFASGREMARAIESACGSEFFHEDQMASAMRQLFEDKIQKTRALLEGADAVGGEPAEGVALGESEDVPTRQLHRPGSGPKSGPRPASQTPPRATPRRPSVEIPASGRAQAARSAPAPARPVAAASTAPAHPRLGEDEDEDEATRQIARSLFDEEGEGEGVGEKTRQVARPAESEESLPPPEEPLPPRRATSLRLGWGIFLLGLLSLSGVLYVRQEAARPILDSLFTAVMKVVEEEQPSGPPPPESLAPSSTPQPTLTAVTAPEVAPPSTTEEPEEPEGSEQEPPPAIEEPAPQERSPKKSGGRVVSASSLRPAGTSTVEPATVGLKRPRKQPTTAQPTAAQPSPESPEKEQEKAPAEPQEQPAQGEKPTATATEPQEQPAQGEKPGDAPAGTQEQPAGQGAGEELEGETQLLDTSTPQRAAKAGLGWLTLYTVPPAAVFDGDAQLGTTPLKKVVLPVGTYRLRVVDPDGVDRLLSAPIKPGKVTQLTIQLSDLPALEEQPQ